MSKLALEGNLSISTHNGKDYPSELIAYTDTQGSKRELS